MPSPRSSPAMRPTTPFSAGHQASSHFDTVQPPSPRAMHSRNHHAQRRHQNTSLKLPSLPRFHPANYPSSHHSSVQSTPDGAPSPSGPLSPRTYQRVYSNAQKQLYINQREMYSATVRSNSPNRAGKPDSPRLVPLGSPGPVTPLELEGEGYLTAGARNAGHDVTVADEIVDQLIRDEVRRQRTKTTSQ